MRALALLLLVIGLAIPASCMAAQADLHVRQVSVAELTEALSAAGVPDEKLADQLSSLQLNQRLSTTTLARLESTLPGPQSKQQLTILAAQSSFLDLPPSELPSTPPPGVAQQREIMTQVVSYVTQTIRKLPDFMATRATRTFEDRPEGGFNGLSYAPLHFIAQNSVNVVYRDGKETDTNSKGKKVDAAAAGLVSWGEFGPILTTVLLDAAKSQLAWGHWEQGASGPLAVFRYTVPAKTSRYEIQFCCLAALQSVQDAVTGSPYKKLAAYHGEMAVDPATGAIQRITVIADLNADDPLINASIAVQYAPVDIGGKTYVCPTGSEAIAQRHIPENRQGTIASSAISQGPLLTRLNEVTFDHYHIFRGESRILTEAEAAAATGEPAAAAGSNPPATEAAAATGEPAAAAGSNPPATEPAPSDQPVASTTQSAPAISAPAPPAPIATPPPTPKPQPAPAVENTPESPPSSADIPVFRTTARQVLVDVVVDKKNGDPVPGLPQSQFSIEEDGKPEAVDFFEEHSASATAPVAAPAMPPLPSGAITNAQAAPPSAALYVFLLDSLNTEPQDQVYVRQQILGFLHKLNPGTEVAVFSLGAGLRLVQGFTSDPASLLAAVSRKEAERGAMAQTRSDDADDAASIATLQAMRSNGVAVLQAAQANAHAYSFGARASMTFEALNALARYLEGIPGRKNLVWFASSFPVVFFPTASELEHLKNNPNLPGYVNRVKQTADLFTLSKIAVYPVSGAGVAASNIGLANSADAGSAGGTGHFGTAASPTSSLTAESIGAGADHASMEQLAASTGGQAFTTNDIDSALRRIVHDSDVYYTLGYAPANSVTDGSFRRIEVKIAGGKYKLAYRQGYNAGPAAADNAPSGDPIAPLLGLGLPNATGILYGASAAIEAQPAGEQNVPAGQNPGLKGPLTRYSVSFVIRAQDVSFSQASNGKRVVKLVVGLKAYGADGAALNWQATREAAELDPARYEEALKSGIPVTLDLDLPAHTSAQIVTAVYDWNSGRSGTLEIPIHP